MVAQKLHIGTILLDTSFLLKLDILIATKRGKAPVLGDNDLLATRELVLRATKGFDGSRAV
jgi:hypothetical protein